MLKEHNLPPAFCQCQKERQEHRAENDPMRNHHIDDFCPSKNPEHEAGGDNENVEDDNFF